MADRPSTARTSRHRALATFVALTLAVGLLQLISAGPASADPAVVVAAGDPVAPWASYSFENETGTAIIDRSGNGHNATWTGTPSYAASNTGNGTAAYVNSPAGSNKAVNYFRLPLVAGQSDGSGSFSYEFWLNEAATTSDSAIVSNQNFAHCYNKGTSLYNTGAGNAVLRGCYGQNGTSTAQQYAPGVTATSVISQWHHIAVVTDRTAGTQTYYVDGVQTSQNTALTSGFNLVSGYSFAVGSEGSGTDTGDGFVNASIDDFNFFTAAITPGQIAADYDATGGTVAIGVTVSNDGNGTATAAPTSAVPGAKVTLTQTPKTGYHFAKWQTSPSGLTIAADGSFTMPAAVVTAKATFSANTYTVHFDAQGGTGTTADQSLTYGQSAPLAANGFSSGDRQFVGWSTTPAGPVVYADGASVSNLTATQGATVTLYAVYAQANSFQVTATGDPHVVVAASSDATGGFVAPGTVVTLTATPAAGYHSGWQVSSPAGLVIAADGTFTMPGGAVVVKAVSTPNAYTVTFNGNGSDGGSIAAEAFTYDQTKALSTNTFTLAGKPFLGWATSATGPVLYTDGQSISNLTASDGATVTLYAKWGRYRAAGDTVAPVASYDFDNDTAAKVTDSSGYGIDAAWTGTSTYLGGVAGKSAYVNGGNVISIPVIAGRTDGSASFSFSGWIGEFDESADVPIVSNGNFFSCTNSGITLFNVQGTTTPGICWGTTVGGTKVKPTISTTSLQGKWHYLSVVVNRTANTVTYFEDGVQTYQSTTGQVSAATNFKSGNPFWLGQSGTGNYYLSVAGDAILDAAFDDFDFYNQPITAAQITNDYNATRPASTTLPASGTSTGSTVPQGFLTDTFHAPRTRVGHAVSQTVSGLWNGPTPTSYSKVSGDDWLSVSASGIVTGTAPDVAPSAPGVITVSATNGTTTSALTVEIPVLGATDPVQVAATTWNLWDAGTHVNDSTLKDLTVIANNGFDIIGVQEDGGTGAQQLATALGWYAYEGGNGVGIVSAWPLTAAGAVPATGQAPATGVTADVLGKTIRVWSTALDETTYGPETACFGTSTPAALRAAELAGTRYAQAKAVTAEIADDTASSRTTPVIVLGDLASPSATDWTAATTADHCGVGAVDWPVPDLFAAAGLTDSFREATPDPTDDPGITWSPIVTTNANGQPEPQDRIDYVYYAGSALEVLGSNTYVAGFPSSDTVTGNSWTSDHAAVVTTFQLGAEQPDTTAPTVAATVDPATPDGSAGWYVAPTTVTLAATDDRDAAPAIEFRVGPSGPWQDYAAPISVPEGVTEITYRATDAAGNSSAPDTIKVQRDGTAPTVTASYDDQHGTAAGPVPVTLSATDAGSGVDTVSWSLDGGSWTNYSGAIPVSGAGSHTLSYRASDIAGNTSAPADSTITLLGPDLTAPIVTAATDPANPDGSGGWFTGAVSLTLAATDDRSGVDSIEYRIGSGDWQVYTAPIAAPQGLTTYTYRSTDKAGNVSVPTPVVVQRDGIAPVALASYDDDHGNSTGPVAVTLAATDADSGVASIVYSLDDGPWTPYTAAISVAGVGSHELTYQATDTAGNTSVSRTATVSIAAPDTTAPVVTAAADPSVPSGSAGWYTGPVSVALSATDDRSGVASIEYSLNGSPWSIYRTSVAMPEGVSELDFRATDTKGNVSTPGSLTVKRDITAPVTVASFDDRGGAASGPVAVTLVSTDIGAGVDTIVYAVDGGAQQTYTGPFQVGGSGATITFHAVDVAGNAETTETATVHLSADHTAPVVTATTSPGTPNGQNGWFTSPITLSLTAADDLTGVSSIEYRINAGNWNPYTGSVPLTEGTSTVDYRATDGAGNVSAIKTLTRKRDDVAPVTTATYNDSGTTGAAVPVILAATDVTSGVSSITYRVDSGAWTAYTKVFSVSGIGTHTVQYYAADVAGNIAVVASSTVVVTGPDKTGPMLSVTENPATPDGTNGYYRRPVAVTAAATDPSGVASVQYRIGSGTWTTYTGALTAPVGTTAYQFKATDTKGNVSAVSSATVKYDNTVPVTTATYDDKDGSTTGPVTVTLKATDTISGVDSTAYRVDHGVWTTSTGKVTVSGAGSHRVDYYSTDKAGNNEVITTAIVTIASIDVTAPDLAVTTNPAAPTGANNWYSGAVSVSASATDPTVVGANTSGVASIEYRVGTGTWTKYGSALAVPVGSTTYSLRSTDKAGNVSPVQTVAVRRDITAPTTGATFTGSGTSTGPIPVTLTASDATSGIDTVSYSLDQSAWTTYTAPVPVTGPGTHHLTYLATDQAGNTSAVKTATIVVVAADTTAPQVYASISPNAPNGANGWWTGAPTLTLNATDDLSGVADKQYRLGDGPWTTYSSAIKVPTGIDVYTYRATDKKGNVSDVQTVTIKRDDAAPTVIAGWTNGAGPVPVTLTASDATSGVGSITYSLDGKPWQVYDGPISVTGAGKHTMLYAATDKAGLTSSTKTATIQVK